MEQLILARSDHMAVVGDRLRRIIKALRIKQVQAAEEMGITKNHLGNWLRGDAYPLHYELYKFCRIHGISTDYILMGDPSGLRKAVWDAILQLQLEPMASGAAGRQAGETEDDG
jgi:transcriptional regulator with XRE-family HTH domain